MKIKEIDPISELKPGMEFNYKSYFKNGGWYNPIKYYMLGGYNIDDGGGTIWKVADEKGIKKIRYKKEIRRAPATLCFGDLEWKDYEFSVSIMAHTLLDYSGIAFRYKNSRCYYALMVGKEDNLCLIKREHENWEILNDSYKIDKNQNEFKLKVKVEDNKIDCFINGHRAYSVVDGYYSKGCIGLVTYSKADFYKMSIKIKNDELKEIEADRIKKINTLKKKYETFPKPKLYKVIDTKGYNPKYGIGLRIIDTKKGPRMLYVQSKTLKPVDMIGNVFDKIACITVTDIEGNILWQRGEPGKGEMASYCCQVCDIDNDEKKELITAMDFEILIIDFETGVLKKKCPTPYSNKLAVPYTDGPEDYFPRICGDHIYVCDLENRGYTGNFLIKDRYNNVWAYDNNLKQLWHMHFNTGHFPCTYDINNDGIKEILLGHRCISADGKVIWMLPLGDHVDNICVGNFEESGNEPRIAYAAGEEGFVLTNLQGQIVAQKKLGHIQKFCVGHFSNDYKGQQFVAKTLWGDQGLIYTLDSKGNLIGSYQKGHASMISAVNWAGMGLANIIHYSICSEPPSIYDFKMNKICKIEGLDSNKSYNFVVKDLIGDTRDEIILINNNEVRIYTQDDNGKRNDVKAMKRGIEEINYSVYKPEWLI